MATFDGYAERAGSNLTWADVHDGSGNISSDIDTLDTVEVVSGSNTDRFTRIIRGILLFDTSSIGSGATITAASLGLYIDSTASDFALNLDMVGVTPGSNSAVADSDYGQFGTTKYATSRLVSGFIASMYNAIELNATGIAAIDKEGITKIGLRISADTADSPPTWIATSSDSVTYGSSDNADSGKHPYLEVVYTGGGGGGGGGVPRRLLLLGVGA